jgi:hypothetical protein
MEFNFRAKAESDPFLISGNHSGDHSYGDDLFDYIDLGPFGSHTAPGCAGMVANVAGGRIH